MASNHGFIVFDCYNFSIFFPLANQASRHVHYVYEFFKRKRNIVLLLFPLALFYFFSQKQKINQSRLTIYLISISFFF